MTMRATYTEPLRTPLSFQQTEAAMRWALKSQIGREPRDVALALALAKTALETGRWNSIWNFNLGNVKAGESYSGNYTCITLNEVLKGKLVWFAPEGELTAAPSKGGKLVGAPIPVPEGHPQTRMRAYANVYDGADGYVDFVAKGRYFAAWKQLLDGDPVGYVHTLKMAGYFTADEATYARGVCSLHREMLARLRSEEPPKDVDLEWAKLVETVPQLQFDLTDLVDTSIGADFPEAIA
jgi:hypothetical protein